MVRKITYCHGYSHAIIPPILRRYPLVRDKWSDFKKARSIIPLHVVIAVRQRDSIKVFNAAKKIQLNYKDYKRQKDLSIARIMMSLPGHPFVRGLIRQFV
mgnify:CR=1 FL=1|tara:strand:+ start:1106 stop:1405 length:300 start_codon:yes stop_codon:yes gene_type:complete